MTPYPNLPYSHNGLRAFESVARLLSFTFAAEELNVTQSAISRQVKQLEADLNVPLIKRKHRTIELTPQGSELYTALREGYISIEGVLASWKEPKQKRIVIKAALSYATRVLISKIRQLNERYPDHEIVIIPVIEEDEALNYADYDLLIFHSRIKKHYHNKPGIRLLREEFMAPVCSQTLATPDINIHSILTLPRLHPTLDHHDWKVWLSDVEFPPTDPVRNTSFLSLDLALNACLSGQGVTVTDLLLILQELERGFLYCPEQAKVQHSDWIYYTHQNNDHPIIDDLVDWLHEETKREIEQLQHLAQQYHWHGVIRG